MLIFTFVVLALIILFQSEMPTAVANLAMPIHEACLSVSPSIVHNYLYQAIVCGAPLSDPLLQNEFATTGLLHIVVVSGSHLVFLEKLIGLIPLGRFTRPLTLMLLGLFTLAAAAQPPVLRAFLQSLIHLACDRFKLQWNTPQRTLAAGILTLPTCGSPGAINSLCLSWSASLALSCFQSRRLSKNAGAVAKLLHHLKMHVRIYLLLAPILILYSLPHPLSILCNWILGPVFGALLFPASLFAFIAHPLTTLTDQVWSLALTLTSTVAEFTPNGWKVNEGIRHAMPAYVSLLTIASLIHARTHRGSSFARSRRKN